MLERMSELLEASDLSVRKSMYIPHESDNEDKNVLDEIERDKEHHHTSELTEKDSEINKERVKAFWYERKKLDEQLKVCI